MSHRRRHRSESDGERAAEVRNVSLLVAVGVNAEGYREILGTCEGAKEDKSGWAALPHVTSSIVV